MNDLISRQRAVDAISSMFAPTPTQKDMVEDCLEIIDNLPSVQPEEAIPHRNYKYLSDYWCACGWHLGKKGAVKYCADCGRKVNWDETD